MFLWFLWPSVKVNKGHRSLNAPSKCSPAENPLQNKNTPEPFAQGVFWRKQFCRLIPTCHPRWADTGEEVGAVNAAAQSAGVRFTVIDVHLTPFTFKSIETHTQVFPAAGREVDVGHTGSSIQTLTGAHRHLKEREKKLFDFYSFGLIHHSDYSNTGL